MHPTGAMTLNPTPADKHQATSRQERLLTLEDSSTNTRHASVPSCFRRALAPGGPQLHLSIKARKGGTRSQLSQLGCCAWDTRMGFRKGRVQPAQEEYTHGIFSRTYGWNKCNSPERIVKLVYLAWRSSWAGRSAWAILAAALPHVLRKGPEGSKKSRCHAERSEASAFTFLERKKHQIPRFARNDRAW